MNFKEGYANVNWTETLTLEEALRYGRLDENQAAELAKTGEEEFEFDCEADFRVTFEIDSDGCFANGMPHTTLEVYDVELTDGDRPSPDYVDYVEGLATEAADVE